MKKAVVVVEPEKPENTGLIARLASNYDYNLRIVNPCFNLSEARKTASNYQDKLRNARIFDSLDKAVEGLKYTVGTKPGKGVEVSDFSPKADVSPVIGRESSGLTNKELEICDATTYIKTPGTSSLNQATATAVILDRLKQEDDKKARSENFQHLEQCFNSKLLINLIRRSNPSKQEINRLLGDLD